MSQPAIVAEHLTVRFRPYLDRRPTLKKSLSGVRRKAGLVTALDDVGFRIDRGEAFGVVGANGAGKSTLLRVLAGTLIPDEGRVARHGRTSTLLQLGVGFNTELSGSRNIYLGAMAAGLAPDQVDERFDAIVEYSGLGHAIDRPLKTYSSGMFSRLAFSVGMYLDPEILLLDEVLAVGDEAFRRKSMRSMRELVDRSGTIVLVSHNLSSIADFCDRAMWLEDGVVREIGPAEEVVGKYGLVARAAPVTLAGREVRPVPDEGWPSRVRSKVVIQLLAGANIEDLAYEYSVTVDDLKQWRTAFVEGGRRALDELEEPSGSRHA